MSVTGITGGTASRSHSGSGIRTHELPSCSIPLLDGTLAGVVSVERTMAPTARRGHRTAWAALPGHALACQGRNFRRLCHVVSTSGAAHGGDRRYGPGSTSLGRRGTRYSSWPHTTHTAPVDRTTPTPAAGPAAARWACASPAPGVVDDRGFEDVRRVHVEAPLLSPVPPARETMRIIPAVAHRPVHVLATPQVPMAAPAR